jgi:hypothetical protein
MRSAILFFVPSIIASAIIDSPDTDSGKDAIETSTNGETTTQSSLLTYLNRVPGQEFAQRQIDYLRVTFESLVTGSTPADAERVTESLNNFITVLIEEGAPERDFYLLGGILNEFVRQAHKNDRGERHNMLTYGSTYSAVEALSKRMYQALRKNILESFAVLEDPVEQALISRTVVAVDDETSWTLSLSRPSLNLSSEGFVEILELLRDAQTRIEAQVGGYRQTERITSAFDHYYGSEDVDIKEKLISFAEDIPNAITEWLGLINSEIATNIDQINEVIGLLEEGGELMVILTIRIYIQYQRTSELNDLAPRVLEAFTKVLNYVLRKRVSESLETLIRESLKKFDISVFDAHFRCVFKETEKKIIQALVSFLRESEQVLNDFESADLEDRHIDPMVDEYLDTIEHKSPALVGIR